MKGDIWLLLGIFALIVLGAILYFLFDIRKKKKVPTDYYALFVLGLVWLVVSIPIKNYVLSVFGIMFSLMGFTNRDKWKKNKRDWKDLTYTEKILLIIAVFVISAFIFTALLVNTMIDSGLLH